MQVLITILIISGRPFLLDDEFPTSSSPAMKNVPVSKYHQPHLEDTPRGSAAEDQKSKPTKKSPAPLSTMATQLEDIPGKSAAEDRKSKPAKKSPAPLSTVASESTEMVMESAEELLNTGKPYFCHYYHF